MQPRGFSDQTFFDHPIKVTNDCRPAEAERRRDIGDGWGVPVEVAIVANQEKHVGLSGCQLHPNSLHLVGVFGDRFHLVGEQPQVFVYRVIHQPDAIGLLHPLGRFDDFEQARLHHAGDCFFFLSHDESFVRDLTGYRQQGPLLLDKHLHKKNIAPEGAAADS